MRFLDKHVSRDKRLLSLERELNRLYQAQTHAPIIPLERPYQRGWMKTYVLDARVSQRPDAMLFRTILTQVNRNVYSRERSFLNRNGDEIRLSPRIIPTAEWLKLAWPASHQRFFGYGCWRLDDQPWTPIKWRRYITGFRLIHMWCLREDIQPHLITHQRVELPKVRSRIAEIETYLSATAGRCRLDWLHGRSRWWRRYSFTAHELRSEASIEEQLHQHTPD
ncbi:hypothetical protein [Opitutus terrae]|uniref:Uncharacterized protein n=1 Tax=Opitutus terrae (strain DSM 11246 / JCM 15787 / PB90-1) TaxID=452637 RepID=B1ZMJ3_OPITP|nr:hypothetical protein [Opitutus terrae]ACB74338.1 hypothetical protein Oter_1050 [Opitutus terrae PB90-1]